MEKQSSVIREGPNRKPGKQAEGAIEQADEPACQIGREGVAGNGELRDHPLRARAKMGKQTIEELLQLMWKKAVEKKVGNNQIVGSGGIPFESIGVMQTDAPASLGPGALNAAIENPQHGLAGVDDIRGQGDIRCQQAGQETSIAIAQKQRVPGAGHVYKLGVTAASEPGSKAQVFEPSVSASDGIEINRLHAREHKLV